MLLTKNGVNRFLAECIEHCILCHRTCLQMAMNHCLETGGEYVEPKHFRLLMNCAEICQTSANFLLSHSEFHRSICNVCAEVCRRCAEDCETVGDLDACVRACRQCAESCAKMAA